MRKMIRPALLLLALALPAAACGGEGGGGGDAVKVAESYFTSLKGRDYKANAALMHPEALATFKNIFTQVASLQPDAGEMQQIFGVRTPAELQALPPAEVYQRFLGTLMQQQAGAMMAQAEFSPVGDVAEGGDSTHVVYRMKVNMMGSPITQMGVLSLRKDEEGGDWKVLLSGEVQGMVEGMKAAVARQQALGGARAPAAAPAGAQPQQEQHTGEGH